MTEKEIERENDINYLSLGDIIRVVSPNNDINNKIFYIEYLDESIIIIVNENIVKELIIKEGYVINEKINEIEVLIKSSSKSYAKLNNFKIGNNIEIKFNNDEKLTGIITNIIEDMIEIDISMDDKIYIDFEYKGIPKDSNIEYIKIMNDIEDEDEDEEDLEPIMIPTDTDYLNKRYTINEQNEDMMNVFINDIEYSKRTKKSIQNILTQIERFNYLRLKFSDFDDNMIPLSLLSNNDKLIIKSILETNNKFTWCIPVTNVKKKNDINNRKLIIKDVVDVSYDEIIVNDSNEQTKLYQNVNEIEEIKELKKNFINYMNESFKPFINTKNKDKLIVKDSTTALFFEDNNHISFRFVSEILNNNIINGVDNEIQVFKPEEIDVKSFITLPYPYLSLSKINLPSSSIMEKVNLSMFNETLSLALKEDIEIRNVNGVNYSNERFFTNVIYHEKNILDINSYLNNIIPSTDFIIKNVINNLKDKLEFFTLFDIYKNLECFEINVDNINNDNYKIIKNEIKNNLNKFVKKYDESLDNLTKKLKDNSLKRLSIKNKNFFDYLYENNEGDINVKNQIDFFIKYFKLKYKNTYEIIKTGEIIKKIKEDDVYNLSTNMIYLKNIFDSKINYNEITDSITGTDDINELEEIDVSSILRDSVDRYQENILENLKKIEMLFEMDRNYVLKREEKDKIKMNDTKLKLKDVVVVETCSSPYESLRDKILKISNKQERSVEILRFINKYCRKCSTNERIDDKNSFYWYFCKDTNCKLLPSFYYDISKCIIENPYDNEIQTKVIDQISKNRGVFEKGKIIDVHTGFTIVENTLIAGYDLDVNSNEVEYEDEDGYDVYGSIVVEDTEEEDKDDEEVIQGDDGDEFDFEFFIEEMKGKELKLKNFDDFEPETYVQEILTKISSLIGLNLSNGDILLIGSKVIYIFDIQNKDILFDLNNSKDGERILKYKIYLVLYLLGILFVHIQTMDIKSIYSYDNDVNTINVELLLSIKKGYPLFDDNDYSGLEIFSKLIKQKNKLMKDKGFNDCLQLDREKEDQTDYFLKNLTKFIKKNLLKNNRFSYEINEFKKNREIQIEKEKQMKSSYSLILPPLNKYPYIENSNDLEPLQSDIDDKIFKSYNKILIFKSINSLISKNVFCSYGIIEKVNGQILNEVLLLKNYLDNNCCNKEGGKMFNVFEYLNNSFINKLINNVRSNEKLLTEVRSVYNLESKYNNLEILKYRKSEHREPFLKDVMDYVNEIIDPNNSVIVDIQVLYEKIHMLYESKPSIKLDFEIKEKVDITEVIDSSKLDEVDNILKELFVKFVNNEDDNNEFEKNLFKYNNNLINKIQNKLKIKGKKEKDFLEPEFLYNKVYNMKQHIKKYLYIPLNEKINNKSIMNKNKLKEGVILKNWGLSKRDKDKLSKYIIDANNYKNYENNSFDEDTIELFKETIDYYKINKNFIDNLEENEILTEKIIILYLRYFFLNMVYKMLSNDNIEISDQLKINEYLLECIEHYVSVYKSINVNIEQVNKGVIISKEDEKDKITDKFSKMSRQQIAVSYELRKNKLGEYGIGLQKGFHKYNKKFEDNN